MNRSSKPFLVAIAGGSGSGKTWLAQALENRLAHEAARLSLDDFYRDLSGLPPEEREKVNFDHPEALDWESLRQTLERLKAGAPAAVPEYDFAAHTRRPRRRRMEPRPWILLEGLWTLRPEWLRRMMDQAIYVECPLEERWKRRLNRDTLERRRTEESVRRQFQTQVLPMHERFVAPQRRFADRIVVSPASEAEVAALAEDLRRAARRELP